MKYSARLLTLLLTVLMFLLCITGCADEQQPNDGPFEDSPATPGDTKPDDTKPDDTKPDDTEPDDTEPDDKEPSFDVQAAENEKIIQIGLLGTEDKTSYLRLVYDSAEHTRLTNIYTHHIVDSGEYEVTEIFRSTNPDTKDDVMVLLRWPVDPGADGIRTPSLIIFREFNTMYDEIRMATAMYSQYNFFGEKMTIDASGTTVYSLREKNVTYRIQLDPPNYIETEILNFLDEYEYFYENEFEENPRVYSHDLIYSCIDGKETMMQENLEQVVPFPWTLIKSVQKRK